MAWLKRLLGQPPVPTEAPTEYDTPWDAVRGFVQDPRWKVEILEEREDWMRLSYEGVTGEALDDPDDEWLHLRFRVPFTERQKADELARYESWSDFCARNTIFRWDIDETAQEYMGDAFAFFEGQYDAVECIRAIFNSAKLLTEESNRIALARRYDVYVCATRSPSVVSALWKWLESPLAPPETRVEHSSYRETSYWMGSTIGSVVQEQWMYYGLIRFVALDFAPYMNESDERRLMLYKLHLDIQRRYPRIRNFVAITPDPKTSGFHETSLAIVVSSGTDAAPIFDRCLKDVYNALLDYTEWFHFDFTAETDPWFDHSVKKAQTGYKRTDKSKEIP